MIIHGMDGDRLHVKEWLAGGNDETLIGAYEGDECTGVVLDVVGLLQLRAAMDARIAEIIALLSPGGEQ